VACSNSFHGPESFALQMLQNQRMGQAIRGMDNCPNYLPQNRIGSMRTNVNNSGMLKAINGRFLRVCRDTYGCSEKNKWCPEEDSNLHDLAIAST
jgi:hypothetical protein